MEHDNGGDAKLRDVSTSSIIAEDSLDNDKIVGSSSSPSSSSSFSCSNHFEVDLGEVDTKFLEFEENDPTSIVLNPESPSMISTSPQACDLDTIYGSLKQSPPVQVMEQPASYDLNRMPSPVFGLRHRSNSEWSSASNESLFSIHTGNNSFSLDGGFSISKSGELNWIDDHSCFTHDASMSCMSPGLPTVVDTSAENERKSESEEPIYFEKENGKPYANPANISRLSDASCQSTSSFAFPILAGGSPSPTKVEAEKPQPLLSTPPAEAAQTTTPKAPPTSPKAGGNQWFHCFSCFPMCC